MRGTQGDLFGEPARDAGQSQWFTPPWLARRLARWVPTGARVLEPSCGTGNLVAALVEDGFRRRVFAFERDERLAAHARERFDDGRGHVAVEHGDFFQVVSMPRVDFAVMNPPFEQNMHMRFVIRALEFVPELVGVFPVSFRFGLERDRELWAARAEVTNVAILPERVDYGGDQSPSFDSVALRIRRRDQSRTHDERRYVLEETWLKGSGGV